MKVALTSTLPAGMVKVYLPFFSVSLISLVVLVQNRQGLQHIAPLSGVTVMVTVSPFGGGLGTDGNGAVVSLADRHAVGGDRAAATAAGGGTRIDSQGTLGNCTDFIISPRFSLENRCGDRNVEAAGSLTIGGGGGTGHGSEDVRRLNAGRQIAVGHGEGRGVFRSRSCSCCRQLL